MATIAIERQQDKIVSVLIKLSQRSNIPTDVRYITTMNTNENISEIMKFLRLIISNPKILDKMKVHTHFSATGKEERWKIE